MLAEKRPCTRPTSSWSIGSEITCKNETYGKNDWIVFKSMRQGGTGPGKYIFFLTEWPQAIKYNCYRFMKDGTTGKVEKNIRFFIFSSFNINYQNWTFSLGLWRTLVTHKTLSWIVSTWIVESWLSENSSKSFNYTEMEKVIQTAMFYDTQINTYALGDTP